jgi:hypothetical protein
MSALNLKLSVKEEKGATMKGEGEDDEQGSNYSDDDPIDPGQHNDEMDLEETNVNLRSFRSDSQELEKYPALLMSPVFCYLGLLILRVPVTVGEIYG